MKQINVKTWKELEYIILSAIEGIDKIPEKHRYHILRVRLLSRISAIRPTKKIIKK